MKTPKEILDEVISEHLINIKQTVINRDMAIIAMKRYVRQYALSLLPSDEEIKTRGMGVGEGTAEKLIDTCYRSGQWDLKQEILNKLQIDKHVLESVCRCGIPAPDTDRECCTICGKLIYPEENYKNKLK